MKGQIEFFRPHATMSCSCDKMMLRLTSSSNVAGSATRLPLSCGLLSDHCIPSSCRETGVPVPPVERSHSAQVRKGREQNGCENQRFPKPGPPQFASCNGPTEEKDRFEIEHHEEHRNEIKFGALAHARRSLRNDSPLVGSASSTIPVPLSKHIRDRQHPDDQKEDE